MTGRLGQIEPLNELLHAWLDGFSTRRGLTVSGAVEVQHTGFRGCQRGNSENLKFLEMVAAAVR